MTTTGEAAAAAEGEAEGAEGEEEKAPGADRSRTNVDCTKMNYCVAPVHFAGSSLVRGIPEAGLGPEGMPKILVPPP